MSPSEYDAAIERDVREQDAALIRFVVHQLEARHIGNGANLSEDVRRQIDTAFQDAASGSLARLELRLREAEDNLIDRLNAFVPPATASISPLASLQAPPQPLPALAPEDPSDSAPDRAPQVDGKAVASSNNENLANKADTQSGHPRIFAQLIANPWQPLCLVAAGAALILAWQVWQTSTALQERAIEIAQGEQAKSQLRALQAAMDSVAKREDFSSALEAVQSGTPGNAAEAALMTIGDFTQPSPAPDGVPVDPAETSAASR
jgi:hypothetical protein